MHLRDLAKRGAGVETYERDPDLAPVADGNGGRFKKKWGMLRKKGGLVCLRSRLRARDPRPGRAARTYGERSTARILGELDEIPRWRGRTSAVVTQSPASPGS